MKVKVTAKNTKVTEFKVFAYDSMTGKFEAAFESMEQLRQVWPSAEIVNTVECDGYTKVYC